MCLAKCIVADVVLTRYKAQGRVVLFFVKYLASGMELLNFLESETRKLGYISGSTKDQAQKEGTLQEFQEGKLDGMIITYDSGSCKIVEHHFFYNEIPILQEVWV